MNLIVKMKFGSHLYGTDTPESDLDFKGVYLPSKSEMFLNEIKKSINAGSNKNKLEGEKNTKDDIDYEIYSLQYFIKLALEGQTNAIDMLHAPNNMLIKCSDTWHEIVCNKNKFYTKNMKAFVGYARTQAAKYGIKGSRLNNCKEVINFLKSCDPRDNLKKHWDKLPLLEHVQIIKHPIKNTYEFVDMYQICGKKFQTTSIVGYVKNAVEVFYNKYSERAKLAAENKGVDFKAISHALRAGYQLKQLLAINTIIYPLKEAIYLRDVKQGKYHYMDEVAPILESLMEEIEVLCKESTLPEIPDVDYWKDFIVRVCNDRSK